jgi:hypothetical protein
MDNEKGWHKKIEGFRNVDLLKNEACQLEGAQDERRNIADGGRGKINAGDNTKTTEKLDWPHQEE